MLYLLYKRIRPGLGLPFGFILMFGIFFNAVCFPLLMVAAGFFLIELYGGLYNDYWDYEEDLRNGRTDKLTVAGYLTRAQARDSSFAIAAASVAMLALTNPAVLLLGMYYAALFIFYSYPGKRLKGRLEGYAVLSSAFLFLPFALALLLSIQLNALVLLFSMFFFFQFMYILCQKDSTDRKDKKNVMKYWKAKKKRLSEKSKKWSVDMTTNSLVMIHNQSKKCTSILVI